MPHQRQDIARTSTDVHRVSTHIPRTSTHFHASVHPRSFPMSQVLITPADLAALATAEPVVLIDTRSPDAYAAGHLPGAVNIHEIFTYLATSTPEGFAELRTIFADAFGKAGLSGKETAVIYEQSMNTG